jgi:hypothetical protein
VRAEPVARLELLGCPMGAIEQWQTGADVPLILIKVSRPGGK